MKCFVSGFPISTDDIKNGLVAQIDDRLLFLCYTPKALNLLNDDEVLQRVKDMQEATAFEWAEYYAVSGNKRDENLLYAQKAMESREKVLHLQKESVEYKKLLRRNSPK